MSDTRIERLRTLLAGPLQQYDDALLLEESGEIDDSYIYDMADSWLEEYGRVAAEIFAILREPDPHTHTTWAEVKNARP